MKQLFTTLCIGACTLSAIAAPTANVIVDNELFARPELQLKDVKISSSMESQSEFLNKKAEELKQYSFTINTGVSKRKAPKKVTAAEITGKIYVTKFFDGDIDCNGYTQISFVNDSIVFGGLANGRDVKGTFDATTGVATIPMGQVIGTHSTYGEIQLATVVNNAISTTGNVTVTFTDKGLTFDNWLFGRVDAGNLIVMRDITAEPSNGMLTIKQNANTFMAPLIVKKLNNAEINVVGISNILYGAYENVAFTLNAQDSTIMLPFGTRVDNQYTQTGYIPWIFAGVTEDGITDLTMKVTVAEGNSSASAAQAFYGYKKTTGGYSGYTFTDVKITADFDVFETVPEPCPVAGNDYVLFFNDEYDDLNEGISIVQGEKGMVTVEGLLNGYDVTGSYDSKLNAIVVPTGVVVGKNSTYGDVTIRAISGNSVTDDPITITIKGDSLLFDKEIAGTVVYQGKDEVFYAIEQIKCVKANASLSMAQGTNVFKIPLVIEKVSDTKVNVRGISNLLYGADVTVPFKLDATAKKMTLPFPTQVDNQYKSTGYVAWYLGGYSTAITDLELNVNATENTTSMTADALFYGYLKTAPSTYSGYKFTDVKIEADFNILTAEGNGEPITDTPEVDGINYKVDFDTKLATVTGCIASLKALDIPATFEYNNDKFTVTAVAGAAFQNNKTITSMTMPATIDTVGKDAFRNVTSLATVNIADLKSWCAIKFANGLANPIYNAFPTTQSKWGKVVVNGEAVTTLAVPEGVTEMNVSFYGFKSLTAVTLPSTLTRIGDQCFTNCINLTEVVIPEGVKTMGSCFYSCTGLKKVTLPSTLTAFTNMTFSGCSALETIELPANLTEIAAMTFYGCTGLKSITSLATVPPVAKVMAFDDVDKTIPVYVPAGAVEAYKVADEWKDFTNIQAMGSSAVEEVGAVAEDAVYFDLNGRRVNGTLTPGVYVRVEGKKTVKVMVK